MTEQLTKTLRVLAERSDLLGEECQIVTGQRITWTGRLRDLGDYGRSGGSAGDRRRIVELMAQIEGETK